uniref:F-box protein 9 n=1 Tax=Tetraselmis sp. GSL018 TaxID=582737 RepID=A0A061QUB9_9CHLO|eukprot:CAMPEP_0177616878 /NCGR_PEP_ID=MMETSP0419_2-20121207/24484_1 /TAXON_ID=582737 /ORGANISM="Tetraselmis sp., Strain GSL018" /LENGTH=306 /DNA_ID=CAMNT_0019115153 /DNA_START=207 /DNA_END=1127 /DNA_ORIENTATION=+
MAPVVHWVPDTQRPWLELYGQRLPAKPLRKAKLVDSSCMSSTEITNDEDPDYKNSSPIQKLLTDDMLLMVFKFVPPHGIASASCVCTAWKRVAESSCLWRKACEEAFSDVAEDVKKAQLKKLHGGSWKRMFLERPHLRFDGIYVSRNTYLRVGEQSLYVKNPVHLVLYFRYLRFLPGGSLVYRTCPHVPSAAAPSMLNFARHVSRKGFSRDGVNIMEGRYRLEPNGRLFTSVLYPGSKSTEMRCKLQLRSTVQGANNRLDVKGLVTYDRELDRFIPQPGLSVSQLNCSSRSCFSFRAESSAPSIWV